MKFNSRSMITIVTPAEATAREQFAAEELSAYIGRILPGITITICTDTEAVTGNRILVGGPERNKATAAYISEAEFDKEVPGPEGMLIRAYGDALIVAGSSKNQAENERGTVYAAYELLERFFGCSFAAYFNPDYAGGEYVPTLEEIDLNGISYVKACADRPYRTAIMEYHGRKVDHILNRAAIAWLAKNRYNRILTWMNIYEKYKEVGLTEEISRRGIVFTVGHHDAIPTFLPQQGNKYFSEHYYETHPEFYKLQEDGTRFVITDTFGGWVLCSRNEEIADVMANNVIEWIEKNPSVDTIALWPMDGKRPMCCCQECSKHTDVENYVFAQNQLAKRIGKTHPHIKIDMLAYSGLFFCPDELELEPNLFIDEAVTARGLGQRHMGKPDGSCLGGTPFEENLLKWKRSGASAVYYEYYMGTHSCRQRYIPAADEMQSNWKRFMEVGIDGSGTQLEYFNFWNHIFNFYCFARTGYDTGLSMQDNLAVFTKIFGEGAPYIQKIITMAEDCLDGQVWIRDCGMYLMDHLDKPACYELFEKALAAATTPAARNNIRLMRMGFRYSDVESTNTEIGRDDFYKYVPYEDCKDPTGELYYMSRGFDSCHWNDPGFGIMFPLDCTKGVDFVPDHWYQFEQ